MALVKQQFQKTYKNQNKILHIFKLLREIFTGIKPNKKTDQEADEEADEKADESETSEESAEQRKN